MAQFTVGAVVCLLTLGLCPAASAGRAPYKLETPLPPLPRGVREAGDVYLTPALWLAELKIVDFRRIDHEDGSVHFWKPPGGMGGATKLTPRQACAMAAAFVDKHVPQLAGRRRFEGVSHTKRVSGIGGGQEKTEIVGHTVYYGFDYKEVPLISDQIVVSIRDDEVKSISVTAHAVKELGGAKRLLTARTVLDRYLITVLKREGRSPPVIDGADFGYYGGYKQSWEEPKKRRREFRALPVYRFELRWPAPPHSGGFGFEYAFDARTGELLYPKPAEGPGQVSVRGPTLTFTCPCAQMCFLIAPRDIQVRSATLDLETSPVEHRTRTFSVREMFPEPGKVEFTWDKYSRAGKIGALRKEQRGHGATGSFRVEQAGRYRIEILVKQQTLGEPTGTVVATINGASKVLGRKGPHTRWLWEAWGELDLTAGRHAISLGPVAGSRGGWHAGPLRLCAAHGKLESRIRDIQITFGRADRVHVAVAAPGDRLTTKDVRDRLHYALAYQTSREVPGRNVTPVTISSAAPGIVRLRALNVSFVTSDARAAEAKARQFLLIGPGGETVRPPTADEVEALAAFCSAYVERHKRPGRNLRLHDSLRLHRLLVNLAERCTDPAAARHRGAAREKWNALVAQEPLELARWLIFAGDSADRGKAPDRPKDMARSWASWLGEIYTGILDPARLTPDGGCLDPWGRPYRLVCPPEHSSAPVEICSFGPDGKDDRGDGDDIASWQPTAAQRKRLRTIAGAEKIDLRRVWVLFTQSGGQRRETTICKMSLAEREIVELGRGERPAWSPDGGKIVFCARNPRKRDIFVMDADGRDVKRLTDDPADDRDPAWSPDGRRIAFASERFSFLDHGHRISLHQVAVMNADGSGQELVTRERNRHFFCTRWRSKDVILCSGQYDRNQVYAVRPGRQEPRFRVLTHGTQPDRASDGKTLAVTHHRRNVHVKADGMAEPIDITRFRGKSTHPVWVGRSWIVFASDRHGGQFDLYRMRPDGGGIERLTETPEGESPSDVFTEPEGAKD